MRHTRSRAIAMHRGKIIVLVRAEQGRLRSSSWRNYARDFALHQFLACGSLLHLFANRDAESGADQARDVAFCGVIRNAAHGNRRVLFFAARRQRDLKFARGGDGVFIEQLVKIAQTEHQQGLRYLLFDRVILPHQRRRGILVLRCAG